MSFVLHFYFKVKWIGFFGQKGPASLEPPKSQGSKVGKSPTHRIDVPGCVDRWKWHDWFLCWILSQSSRTFHLSGSPGFWKNPNQTVCNSFGPEDLFVSKQEVYSVHRCTIITSQRMNKSARIVKINHTFINNWLWKWCVPNIWGSWSIGPLFLNSWTPIRLDDPTITEIQEQVFVKTTTCVMIDVWYLLHLPKNWNLPKSHPILKGKETNILPFFPIRFFSTNGKLVVWDSDPVPFSNEPFH